MCMKFAFISQEEIRTGCSPPPRKPGWSPVKWVPGGGHLKASADRSSTDEGRGRLWIHLNGKTCQTCIDFFLLFSLNLGPPPAKKVAKLFIFPLSPDNSDHDNDLNQIIRSDYLIFTIMI